MLTPSIDAIPDNSLELPLFPDSGDRVTVTLYCLGRLNEIMKPIIILYIKMCNINRFLEINFNANFLKSISISSELCNGDCSIAFVI